MVNVRRALLTDPLRTESLLAALTSDPSEQVAADAGAVLDRIEAKRNPEDPSAVIELNDAIQRRLRRAVAHREGASI